MYVSEWCFGFWVNGQFDQFECREFVTFAYFFPCWMQDAQEEASRPAGKTCSTQTRRHDNWQFDQRWFLSFKSKFYGKNLVHVTKKLVIAQQERSRKNARQASCHCAESSSSLPPCGALRFFKFQGAPTKSPRCNEPTELWWGLWSRGMGATRRFVIKQIQILVCLIHLSFVVPEVT